MLKRLLNLIDAVGTVSFGLYAAQQLASALMPPPRLPVADAGVRVTFLVPALNEARVIAATVGNLRAAAPGAQVVVIDDASDDGTDAIVRRLAASDPAVRLLRREFPEARQNKGRAMNWAVRQLLEEGRAGRLEDWVFVGIDADGRIGPDFIPQVRGAFQNPDVMAAQGWMRYRLPTGRLPGLHGALARILLIQQDLENFMLGHTQRVRHAVGTASLTGNGQCMRASYVARQLARGVLPWPDVLLEDFGSALEIRLERSGNKIAMLTAQVGQQGMLDALPFIRQRARWIQGTMECLPYLPPLLGSRTHPATRIEFSYLILGPWLNTLLTLSLLSPPLRRARGITGPVRPRWWGPVMSGLPLLLQLQWAMRYVHEKRLPWSTVPYIMLTLPVFTAVTFWSLPLALKRQFTGEKGWYKSLRHDEETR